MALDFKNAIARRVAQELQGGQVVNLGIGIPTLVANHISADKDVIFQAENGILNIGPMPPLGQGDFDIFDAGCLDATILPGGSFFNSADSFGLIRGGHVDVTVLGAIQVDEAGNLANWIIPDKMIAGYGGAMDLITCAKKVILAMEHTTKGDAKILKKCTFPLTGRNCVDLIVTEMGVMEVTEKGLVLIEVAEGLTAADVQAATEADLIISENLKVVALS